MGEMKTNPGAVAEIVSALLAEAEGRKVFAVRLHPDDLERLKQSPGAVERLEKAKIALQASPEIKPGGVILETGFGKLDARLETRLDEMTAALLGNQRVGIRRGRFRDGRSFGRRKSGNGNSVMSIQQEYIARIERTRPYRWLGRVSKIIGLVVESNGPAASVGEMVEIRSLDGNRVVTAEVVGFRDDRTLLMPLSEMSGIAYGDEVVSRGRPVQPRRFREPARPRGGRTGQPD